MQVMQLRVMKHRQRLMAGDATPLHSFELGTAVPEGFMFSRGRPLPVRQLLLHRRVEHLSLRAGDGEARGAEQCRSRLISGRCRSMASELLIFHYSGAGIRAGDDRAATDRRPERHQLPRRADRHAAPGRAALGAGPPSQVDYDDVASAAEATYQPCRELALESIYPGRGRLQGLGRVRLARAGSAIRSASTR